MRTRAERRHHKNRVKKKWLKTLTNTSEWNSRRMKFSDTRCVCSCYMCCNPRSKNSWSSGEERLTMQERKELSRGRLIDRIVGS